MRAKNEIQFIFLHGINLSGFFYEPVDVEDQGVSLPAHRGGIRLKEEASHELE